jgi:hypothetical protein
MFQAVPRGVACAGHGSGATAARMAGVVPWRMVALQMLTGQENHRLEWVR